MSLKEILVAEEIGKIFISSIPQDNGNNRLFVYFNQIYPELDPGEIVEYEGDVEDVATNNTKVFVENNVEYTLEELIIKALHDECELVGEEYPY